MHQLRLVSYESLKKPKTVLCVWMPTTANLTDMYAKNLTPQLYDRHHHTIVRDNNDNDDENMK